MGEPELESLWAFGDPEPWRRGRFAIATISTAVIVAQALGLAGALLRGDIKALLAWAVGGAFACLLLFLIWIGQNWARWIVAPFFALFGFTALVWAAVYSDGRLFYAGKLFLSGLIALTMFSYLALSPAVYAFARRQRDRATLLESLTVGAGLLLVLGSIASALLAFQLYKNALEQEATEFAQLACRRVFQNHDAAFLEAHSSATRKHSRPAQFINLVDDQLGQLQTVGPFAGQLNATLDGRRIVLAGALHARAVFEAGGVWIHIGLVGSEGEWSVEHISWSY